MSYLNNSNCYWYEAGQNMGDHIKNLAKFLAGSFHSIFLKGCINDNNNKKKKKQIVYIPAEIDVEALLNNINQPKFDQFYNHYLGDQRNNNFNNFSYQIKNNGNDDYLMLTNR